MWPSTLQRETVTESNIAYENILICTESAHIRQDTSRISKEEYDHWGTMSTEEEKHNMIITVSCLQKNQNKTKTKT